MLCRLALTRSVRDDAKPFQSAGQKWWAAAALSALSLAIGERHRSLPAAGHSYV